MKEGELKVQRCIMHLKFMEVWLNQWNRSWNIGKEDGCIHFIVVFYDKFDETRKPRGQ
jgi:hypothetical protein